jgi:hypothetical protein
MKTIASIKTTLKAASLLLYLALCPFSPGCANLPQDDAGAKLMKFENIRTHRYTEMFLICGNAITKNLRGGVYNTLNLNDDAGTGDTCPAEILDKVDIKALKKEYKVLAAFKNGPRLWTLDWTEALVGKERDFNGLKARWVTWLDVPKGVNLHEKGGAAYKKITVHRNTQFGFNKGTQIYILDDPEGNPWVMKSASLIFDPNQKYEDLKNLGSRLKPAKGWKFHTVVLDKDLVLTPDNGVAHITQDDIGNTYDRAGGAYSNFKP